MAYTLGLFPPSPCGLTVPRHEAGTGKGHMVSYLPINMWVDGHTFGDSSYTFWRWRESSMRMLRLSYLFFFSFLG